MSVYLSLLCAKLVRDTTCRKDLTVDSGEGWSARSEGLGKASEHVTAKLATGG